jgi:hypothetical protein
MAMTYRHRVGKSTVSGYLVVRPEEEDFFGRDPGTESRSIEIEFGDEESIQARLYRATGKTRSLKLSFTGQEGQSFRRWLKRHCPPRKGRKPRGILVMTRKSRNRFEARIESIADAEVRVLELGAQRFFAGARPLSVLHPALIDLRQLLEDVALPKVLDLPRLQSAIEKVFLTTGWARFESPGGGLALDGGCRRSGAQLHLVLRPEDLYLALVSVAAAFELKAIDMGLLLVADGKLARSLQRDSGTTASSLDRAIDHVRTLGFLIRGPLCVFALSERREIR